MNIGNTEHMGELLIDWTARFAVGCYLIRMLADVAIFRLPGWLVRDVWRMGAVIFLLHVLAAFHFEHQWSHAEAYRHTAEQTEAAIGWNSGFGLYLNYFTLVWWVVDAATNWIPFPISGKTRRRYRIVFHAYFGFMVFNATVIFGPWGWRIVGVLLVLLIARNLTNTKPTAE